MNKQSKKRSSIWESFISVDESCVKCKHCSAKIRRNVGSTSNMHRHLVRSHSALAHQAEVTKAMDENSDLLGFVLIKNFESVESLSYEGSERLLEFLGENAHHLPSSSSVERSIEGKFQKFCQLTSSLIKELECYSISCDFWQDEGDQRFLVVTLHFTDEDFAMHSRILKVQEVEEVASVVQISQLIEKTFRKWGVEKEKLVALVTGCDETLTEAALEIVDSHKHNQCIVQTIDGIVQAALDTLAAEKATLSKLRAVVRDVLKRKQPKDFPSSALATAIFNERSSSKKCNNLSLLKLVCLYLEFQHSIDAAYGEEALTKLEVALLQDIAELSKPLLGLVSEIAVSHYVEASITLPIVSCMLNATRRATVQSEASASMRNCLSSKLLCLFEKLSSKQVLAVATLLDPAYKRVHFADEQSLEAASSTVDTLLLDVRYHARSEEPPCKKTKPVWTHHDELFQKALEELHNVEFEQYLSMPLCDRRSDSVLFWKTNKICFPKLSYLACKFRSIPATSFLPETVFSETQSTLFRKLSQLSNAAIKEYLVLHDISFEEWEALSD